MKFPCGFRRVYLNTYPNCLRIWRQYKDIALNMNKKIVLLSILAYGKFDHFSIALFQKDNKSDYILLQVMSLDARKTSFIAYILI